MADFNPDDYIGAKTATAPNAVNFDPDSYISDKTPGTPGTSWGDTAKSAAVTGLQGAGKALDYQAGLSRAAIANLIQKTTGKDLTTPNEAADAINPTTSRRFPGSSELLARAGVPSGPSLSSALPDWAFQPKGSGDQYGKWNPGHYLPEKGGMLDVTPRGAAGAALDMATDPLTYESFGANKAMQAAKAAGEEASPALKTLSTVLNPASNATEAIGIHNYDKGMAPLINKGEQYGKDVGDTFYNNGIWGRSSKIAEMGDAAAEKLKASRDDLMNAATDAGAQPSLSKAFEPLFDHLSEMTADGRISHEDAMNILNKAMGAKGNVANPSLAQMSQWKTDLSNYLPQTAYDVTKNSKLSQTAGKIAAGGNRDEVARAANEAFSGSGDAINGINKDLGDFLTVQGVADKQAQRELGRRLVQPQDVGHAMIAGASSGNPAAGAATLGARIGAATINSTPVRTGVGYGMRKLGTGAVSAPVLDAASFNMLRNMANKNQPVAGVGK